MLVVGSSAAIRGPLRPVLSRSTHVKLGQEFSLLGSQGRSKMGEHSQPLR